MGWNVSMAGRARPHQGHSSRHPSRPQRPHKELRIQTINKLIKQKDLHSPDYKTIELIEVQIPIFYGPFQQLYEKKGVYELAFNEAVSELQEHEKAAPVGS